MKKLLFVISALLPLALSLVSCDKIKGEDDDSSYIITDNKLIGTWNVVKYEALDRDGEVIDTEAGTAVISETYYKFIFDSECNMVCYADQSTGWYGITSYAYFSSTMDLLFGDSGEAIVTTLSDVYLIFESTSFAPMSWYDTATERIKSGISTVRVTCMKVTE